MNIFLSLAFFVVVTFSLLAGPIAALADAPIVTESEFTIENETIANCGDFLIISNGNGTSKLTTYVSSDGVPVRVLFQGRYGGTLTNSVTGVQLIHDPSIANIFIDLEDETQTNVGAFWTITLQGDGVVLFEVGKIVFGADGFPTFIAGPHLPGHEQFEILCAALD